VDAHEAAGRWVDAWLRGWRDVDPAPIIPLYAEDCLFISQPFREHERPADYITRALAEEEWAEPWFGKPIVEEDRAAVEWHTVMREEGMDVTIAGTSLLRFGEDGLCVEQRDVWAVEEGRIERG
jgi:SnoaL-like domain